MEKPSKDGFFNGQLAKNQTGRVSSVKEFSVYLVGGAVRDGLLGQAVCDRDWVVVGATPEQMLTQGYEQVGKDFPVFLHPQTKEEYALARTERKSGHGYYGFEVFSSPDIGLEEDLIRRDLTINAMAQAEDGTVIDPYGGQADLEQRVLRHVSEAFVEDPLRVLRVARFAAKLAPYGFTVAPETSRLMQEMAESGELEALTPERVWQEVVKALHTDYPAKFFDVLEQVGALAVLFPELAALKGVEQPMEYHPEGDVWTHSLMVLQAATKLSDKPIVRFAALVHDVGKGVTPQELWPKHHGHDAAGVPLVEALCQRYRVPKKWQQLALRVTEWHGVIHQALMRDAESANYQPHLRPITYLKILRVCGALKDVENFRLALLACEADSKGRLGFESESYPQTALWMDLAKEVAKVDNRAIIAQGHKGAAIAKAIEDEQLRLIADYLIRYPVLSGN